VAEAFREAEGEAVCGLVWAVELFGSGEAIGWAAVGELRTTFPEGSEAPSVSSKSGRRPAWESIWTCSSVSEACLVRLEPPLWAKATASLAFSFSLSFSRFCFNLCLVIAEEAAAGVSGQTTVLLVQVGKGKRRERKGKGREGKGRICTGIAFD